MDASVLPEGDDPNNPTPEQAAFRARIQREQELDENFGRGEIAQDVGRVASGAGAMRQNEQRLNEDRKKESKEKTDRQMLLAAMEDARTFAEERQRAIGEYERSFEEEFGDAWREEIALRVMGSDDIPERQPGESIEDYREHLTDELIETMIDPETHQIRPEYQDNPELQEYAQWALNEHLNEVAERASHDPDAVEEYLNARRSFNANQQMDQALENQGVENARIEQDTNVDADTNSDGQSIGAENTAFGL